MAFISGLWDIAVWPKHELQGLFLPTSQTKIQPTQHYATHLRRRLATTRRQAPSVTRHVYLIQKWLFLRPRTYRAKIIQAKVM